MYLVDTNVWLERLLHQERSEEVGQFLERTPSDQLFITDFTLHSVGIILARLRKPEAFRLFVRELLLDGDVSIVHLDPADTIEALDATSLFHLDFDDAYQYIAAKKHNLTLISLDADFDRTDRGRKTPGEV